jgi:N-acetylmuramoyl-L-alanine amidase
MAKGVLAGVFSGCAARPDRRALLLGAAGLLLGGAGPARMAGFSLATQGGRTVLTIPLGGAIAWRLSAAANPPRLTLLLPGLTWRGPARLPAGGIVTGGRHEGQALLLYLAGPIAAPAAREAGGRLILELAPGPAAGFTRLADGRALASAGSRAAQPQSAQLRTGQPRTGRPLIVLDPGHGGRDPGTIGGQGTLEKRITLAAALELKRQLEAAGRCRVALTRARDVFVPLGDRIEQARRREAALFLSLHADSAPGARGASVYTLAETASDSFSAALARRENAADQAGGLRLPSVPPEVARILLSLMRQETRSDSEAIARLAVAALEGEVPLLPNTHRRAGFVVLKAPDVPAALVEMGFLSNPQDEAALNRPAHRAKLAAALAEAVHGFLGARGPALAGLG